MKLSNRISQYAFQVRYAAAPTPEDREIYQKEWQTYKKQHPDTNKDEQEYIADRLRDRDGKPKQKKEDNDSYSPLHAEVEEMDDEPTEVEVEEYESEIAPRVEVEEIPDDDADGEDIPSTKVEEVKPKSKPHPLDHPDDAQTLSDLDVAPDVDKNKLHRALSKILLDRDKDGDDLTDKFRSAVDKIVDVVDFDSYVKSLPSEAKQLADHLKKKQEKAEEHASKVISSGGSYADYKKLKLPAHAVSWKRFKELQEKADKAAQEAQEEAKGKGVEVKEKGKKPKKDKSPKTETPKTETPKTETPKTETPKTETPNTVPALFNDLFEDKGDSTGDSDSDTKVEAPKAPEPDKKKKVVVEDRRVTPEGNPPKETRPKKSFDGTKSFGRADLTQIISKNKGSIDKIFNDSTAPWDTNKNTDKILHSLGKGPNKTLIGDTVKNIDDNHQFLLNYCFDLADNFKESYITDPAIKEKYDSFHKEWMDSSIDSPVCKGLHQWLSSIDVNGDAPDSDDAESLDGDHKQMLKDGYHFQQAVFKHLGVTHVTLYRGVADDQLDTEPPKHGDTVRTKSRPASSWSASPATAQNFGSRMIKCSVPVGQILMSPMTHAALGDDGSADTHAEHEYVVMGAEDLDSEVFGVPYERSKYQ